MQEKARKLFSYALRTGSNHYDAVAYVASKLCEGDMSQAGRLLHPKGIKHRKKITIKKDDQLYFPGIK